MDKTQPTPEEATKLLEAARVVADWFLFDGSVGMVDDAMRGLILSVRQIDARAHFEAEPGPYSGT